MTLSAWIAAGSTLISLAAVCATFYGIIHTNKVNRDMQDDRLRSEERLRNRDMLREKGEELYKLIHDLEVEFGAKVKQMAEHLYLSGKEGFSDIMKMDEERALFTRLEMLVKVYFPSCEDALASLSSVRSHLLKTLRHITATDDPALVRERSSELWDIRINVTRKGVSLQKAVIAEMQELHADVIRRPTPSESTPRDQ